MPFIAVLGVVAGRSGKEMNVSGTADKICKEVSSLTGPTLKKICSEPGDVLRNIQTSLPVRPSFWGLWLSMEKETIRPNP